jgi:deoxyribodipyrimidine photo-lyase
MIQKTRVRELNDVPVRKAADGRYVLYWMQQSQRALYNHALEYAVTRANELGLPLLVGFGLMDDYPEANERHYAFMLEGLRDVAGDLKRRGAKFVLRHGPPPAVALELARSAALVICDRGYQRLQKRWRDEVADKADRRVIEVESDAVVPVEVASDKQESAARTLRPKIRRHLDEYLVALRPEPLDRDSSRLRVQPARGGAADLNPVEVEQNLAKLKIDRSIPRSRRFEGGSIAAGKLLTQFVSKKLTGYAENRREPAAEGTSTLSAYLHFGQISPLHIALAVKGADSPAADREAYLEESIVRRELAVNFVHYCPAYDVYEGLPNWAKKSLQEHAADARPILYTLAQLESAQTHDPYWNAAQREMSQGGYMHNSMRMYWGKRILEWTKTAQEAFRITLHLNNKYFLCGRDPNAYANVGWIFGLHDRPWGPRRKIFGLVRYMNSAGLERKFDIDAYVRKWG